MGGRAWARLHSDRQLLLEDPYRAVYAGSSACLYNHTAGYDLVFSNLALCYTWYQHDDGHRLIPATQSNSPRLIAKSVTQKDHCYINSETGRMRSDNSEFWLVSNRPGFFISSMTLLKVLVDREISDLSSEFIEAFKRDKSTKVLRP